MALIAASIEYMKPCGYLMKDKEAPPQPGFYDTSWDMMENLGWSTRALAFGAVDLLSEAEKSVSHFYLTAAEGEERQKCHLSQKGLVYLVVLADGIDPRRRAEMLQLLIAAYPVQDLQYLLPKQLATRTGTKKKILKPGKKASRGARRSDKCKFPGGCDRRASFGLSEDRKHVRCAEHKEEGMVNVVRRPCTMAGCDVRPSFGWLAENRVVRCAKHKEDGMERLNNDYHRICEVVDCTRRPRYGMLGLPPTRCAGHRVDGMVAVLERLCQETGCPKQARYGFEGSVPTRCARHRMDGQVLRKKDKRRQCNVEDEQCEVRPSFGHPGTRNPTRCVKHKEPGMVSQRSKKRKAAENGSAAKMEPPAANEAGPSGSPLQRILFLGGPEDKEPMNPMNPMNPMMPMMQMPGDVTVAVSVPMD